MAIFQNPPIQVAWDAMSYILHPAAGRCPFVFQSCAWPGRTALSSTATTQPLGMWTETFLGTLGTLGYGFEIFEDVWRCWKPWQNFHFAEDYLLTTKSSVCLGGWHGFLGSGCGPSCEALQALPLNYSRQSSQAPQMKTWSGLWWAYVYIYI